MITSGFGYFQTGPAGRPIQQVSQYLLYTDINYVSGMKIRINLHRLTSEQLFFLIRTWREKFDVEFYEDSYDAQHPTETHCTKKN